MINAVRANISLLLLLFLSMRATAGAVDGAAFASGTWLEGTLHVGSDRAHLSGAAGAIGIQGPAGDDWAVGTSLTWTTVDATLKATPQTSLANAYQFLLFFAHSFGSHWSLRMFGGGALGTISTSRVVSSGTGASTLYGHSSSSGSLFGASLTRQFNFGRVVLSPELSGQYADTIVHGFTESGGSSALTFRSFSEPSLALRAGANATIQFRMGRILLQPLTRIAFAHDFEGPASVAVANAANPGVLATLALTNTRGSWLEAGTGMDAQLGAFTLGAEFDSTFLRPNLNVRTFSGRLSYRW